MFGALAGVGFALLTPEAIAQRMGNAATRSISIRRMQTNETFEGVYWREGRYDRDVLQQLDWVLRDPNRAEATPMDPRLFDVLTTVQRSMESTDAWEVISGYRAPESNAARARESRRVSRRSLHMSGMACDCRLPGRNSLGIARVAADMQTGGVGLYRRDGFVHLDCGPSRRW
ncbi:MAG: transcriptional initiation protein Tat [Rubritepida sp.]|nr:transcriptional initiation protein Tat [Rubritepida sp.]